MPSLRVIPMTADNAAAVLAIYQAGLDTGNASFETVAPDWPTWDANHLPSHRFVAVDHNDDVLGWVAASAVSGRCVYAGVIEHSVYVRPESSGQGVGRALLEQLIASADANGVWTIETGIFPENAASLALHQAIGFRIVGRRERIGQHNGKWRDTLLLERRSPGAL
ncbi:MAG TPA: GNAT family N-acetyltransferase [Mycobacteriales bacterium]|nr:GNAT family N-acetyltransferase [Mycobacteriales bacterium]